MSLRELQQAMFDAVVGKAPLPELWDKGDFGVVVRSVRGGRIALLRERYPKVHDAMGTDLFARAALGFWRTVPQNTPDISTFGDAWVPFLAAAFPDEPHWAELAKESPHGR